MEITRGGIGRVVINLYPVSAGGGLQNALSFLAVLSKTECLGFEYLVLCRSGGAIHELANKLCLNVVAFPDGFKGRLLFELVYARRAAKDFGANVIFTLFGNCPLISYRQAVKISGFAYSNIIQPEINFWGWLPWYSRSKKWLVDVFRYWTAITSDILIVETDYLFERSKQGVFRGRDVRVVRMAPSSLVVSMLSSCNKSDAMAHEDASTVRKVLYLSGPHPNKRIHLLPKLFFELSKLDKGYKLVTTLPDCDYLSLIRQGFESLGISELHENIGPVAPQKVAECLCAADAVINVAKLESFSNNWVEAWAAELPLIATDAPWSRASCGDAAIYVDVENPAASARIIHETLSSRAGRQSLIIEGRKVLLSLPTAEQRTRQYVDIIESSFDGGGG